MSSLALYRRYRPETFAEVIGQEHVTDPLQQALRNNRVNHAYLFSGPRGCGKTTSARILARCLNCEQGPTPTPCGECRSCRDLARNGPGSIDVIEIDAASHGGVDDARDLREKAFFGPAGSRYKIYIIDEAHMVTSAGFNALLKVVEEPPEHLKFIFATTEPEKVIGTIRSRTHHYPFRLVPPGTLRDYLGQVCAQEDIPVEDGVLPLVVRAGAGSVRDSMSVMDQLLAGAGEDGVTYAMATSLLGYTDGSLLDAVVEAFATGDGAAAFEVVDRVVEGGNDPRRFVADLLERLRDLVILAAVPDAAEKGLIDGPAEVVERMQAQASTFGAAELSRAADLVNTGLTEMRGATSPRLQLELICARVLLPAAYDDERSLQARLERLERGAHFQAAGPGPAAGYVPGPGAHMPDAVPPAPIPAAPA
ncbi:DNA polymerase III subunit gamma and tau, partial [Streptomyces sp. CC77]|uniref:DNA polymerase III subunit gamma and tau n=3 Tax=unclassified Streptomyces TaxID=2593676 RepID=UPI0011142C2C